MQIFDENKSRSCHCNDALKKGIFTKTICNDNFSIYGNLMHGKSILLNYSGKLAKKLSSYNKKNSPNIYIYYCFDNNWDNKKIVNMSICNQTNSLTYCTLIENIPESTNINIAFTDDNNNWDTDIHGTYCLKIYPDIEKNIIKRYGLDSMPPVIKVDKLPNTHIALISTIKSKINNIFSIFTIKTNK